MKKPIASVLAISVLAALVVASAACAGADNSKVVGTWALELMYEGQKQAITLEIKTKEDGSLTGTWIGPASHQRAGRFHLGRHHPHLHAQRQSRRHAGGAQAQGDGRGRRDEGIDHPARG